MFTKNQLRYLFRELLEAGKSLHEHGMIQGDFKPANILLSELKDTNIFKKIATCVKGLLCYKADPQVSIRLRKVSKLEIEYKYRSINIRSDTKFSNIQKIPKPEKCKVETILPYSNHLLIVIEVRA